MSKTDWKIGDKFRVTDEDFKIGYPNVYEVTKLTKANDGVYCIVDDNITVIFAFEEIEKIEDQPIIQEPFETILVVNKKMPEFSVYVEKTEEAIKKFFFGTRLEDFYVIDSGKLIELKTSKDVESLTKCEHTIIQDDAKFDKIFTMNVGDSIEIDDTECIIEGGPMNFYIYTKYKDIRFVTHLRQKGETTAWYTRRDFVEMLTTGNYEFS